MLNATFWLRLLIAVLVLSTWNQQTQADDKGYKDITAPEVKEMIESGKGVLVHVLSRIEYEMQHIPSSINIPITEMHNTTDLPQAKSTPIVFYCMGTR